MALLTRPDNAILGRILADESVQPVNQLALKLILTPLLIGAASLAGRRWGPTVSGWLIGIPFTSGPVAFFLALGHGPAFAAAAAAATMAGAISQAAFCLAYSWAAARAGWPRALAAGSLGFCAVTALLNGATLPTVPLYVLALALLALAPRAMPRLPVPDGATARPTPWWDIPARMVITTALVLLLTAGAPLLGARLTGLLAPFPLYGTILATFAHQQRGPAAASGVLRGLLFGLFGFASFFLVLALLLGRAPLGWAFAAAAAAALAGQAATLGALRGGET